MASIRKECPVFPSLTWNGDHTKGSLRLDPYIIAIAIQPDPYPEIGDRYGVYTSNPDVGDLRRKQKYVDQHAHAYFSPAYPAAQRYLDHAARPGVTTELAKSRAVSEVLEMLND